MEHRRLSVYEQINVQDQSTWCFSHELCRISPIFIMCRLKWHSLGPRFVWRFVAFMGTYLLVLGALSFGLGLKLMEYAENPDLTPVIAGLPTLVAGILGLFSRLGKKKWTITCFTIASVISGVLAVHMVYRFIGKELKNLPVYGNRCRSDQDDSNYYCDLYAGTIVLSTVSILMIPIAPLAMIIHYAAKRILQDKDCYIIWCHSGNVQPLQEVITVPPKNHYLVRRNDSPEGRYTSRASLTDINYEEMESSLQKDELEYLPRIPNFQNLTRGNSRDELEYTALKAYAEPSKSNPNVVIANGGPYDGVSLKEESERNSNAAVNDFEFLSGNDLYQYDTQEELIMGYLDQTVSKRRRATGVSDESDIEKRSSKENEEVPNANINLGYTTLPRSRKTGASDVLDVDKEDRGLSKVVNAPGSREETNVEKPSPLGTRRGVHLTVNCNNDADATFRWSYPLPPKSLDVDNNNGLTYSTSQDLSISGASMETRTDATEQRKGQSFIESPKGDRLDIDSSVLASYNTPYSSDVTPTELRTPGYITPKGRLSFMGLDGYSPSSAEGASNMEDLEISPKGYGSTGFITLPNGSATDYQQNITGKDDVNAEVLPSYDLREDHNDHVAVIDEMFSDHAKLWIKTSAPGKTSDESDLVHKNMTREELETLLPYIM